MWLAIDLWVTVRPHEPMEECHENEVELMMRDLYNAMPEPEILLALSPEELGGKIIFSILKANEKKTISNTAS